MKLIRIKETDEFVVDYDKERNMYRVSTFENNHFLDEYWFKGYEELTEPNITNDENKSCMVCKHSYLDDDFEVACKQTKKVCITDIKNFRYETCDEWTHE